ncbi:monooxygenase FAD-binding protein [Gracilaria domingensis]|nr:monooxygenase FAD-binding protein [Gracilaria domingensis]
MSDTQKQIAIVVGGSLGGLTAAICLRDIGFSVSVFERSEQYLSGKGAGIGLNPHMMSFIRDHPRFGLSEHSITVKKFRYLDLDQERHQEHKAMLGLSSYNSVYKALLEIFGTQDYHLAQNVTDISQSTENVKVTTSDGIQHLCHLLVCADGSGSHSKRMFTPDKQPAYAGYYAWRGIVKDEHLPSYLVDRFEDAVTFHLRPDGHILSYPIPYFEADEYGKLVKSTYVNWLWYRNLPDKQKLEKLLVDSTGKQRLKSVPRGFVSSHCIEELKADASGLQQDFRELVELTQDPFIQPIFDFGTERMVVGRVCLVGDAAFSVRPHVAVGTAKAWDDAVNLASFLKHNGGDLHSALNAWEAKQLALGGKLLKRSVDLGIMLQHGKWSSDRPSPFGLYEEGDSYEWKDSFNSP